MLLYDVFYPDHTMDMCTPLPAVADDGAVAVCTNWDRRRYVGVDGEWTIEEDD